MPRSYRPSECDCDTCALKPRCCPGQPVCKILKSIHEGARYMAGDIAEPEAHATSHRQRRKAEMTFAHRKRIRKLGRLRLDGPCGAGDNFLLVAAAQSLRELARDCTPQSQVPAT